MGIIDDAINWARSMADNPNAIYVYGAAGGRDSLKQDCSSFACAAYNVPRTSTGGMVAAFKAAGFGDPIPYSNSVPLQPGDILLVHNDSIGKHHAAMYLGPGNSPGYIYIIDASWHYPDNPQNDIAKRHYSRSVYTDYQYILRYPNDMPTVGTYGYSSETPSIWNSGGNTTISSGSSSSSGETASSVEYVQTGTDDWGNPIGYSYTTGYNFTPYIARVGPNANKVDYPALVSAKVSGMMFCAGWLYNDYHAGHTPRKEYVNPHLKDQIAACEEAGYPYGLYAIVRAKNRIEADRECRDLYYVVSKYPPRLGLWLLLDMHNSPPPTMNEIVLDCYYKYITDWGLNAKCGLYLDKGSILQIDWNKYQNKFYLWLEDHITDQHTLDSINDEVLKSSFFEVE